MSGNQSFTMKHGTVDRNSSSYGGTEKKQGSVEGSAEISPMKANRPALNFHRRNISEVVILQTSSGVLSAGGNGLLVK